MRLVGVFFFTICNKRKDSREKKGIRDVTAIFNAFVNILHYHQFKFTYNRSSTS